ncbi:MAG TPA: response regulator, partial [Nevskiaceae bacterium]|nr:response regulator [Nevskiaceae bacterium]
MTTTESEVQARTRQRALIDFGQAPENRPRSVLVVDDDDFVRGSLAKQLAFLGVARVVTAGDGDLACQALRVQGPFDVMISDLQMPGTDGIELLRRIHDIQPGLSVLLISSMDGKVLGAAEELAGARGLRLLGCLPKPVQLSALRRTLERLDHGLTQPAAHAPQRSQVTSQELRDAI